MRWPTREQGQWPDISNNKWPGMENNLVQRAVVGCVVHIESRKATQIHSSVMYRTIIVSQEQDCLLSHVQMAAGCVHSPEPPASKK